MEKVINDLPVDVWPFIFRYLKIKDLFNCRLVNKKFKDFSDHTDGIYKLAIGKLWSFEPYFENKELIKDEDVISFKSYQRIKSLSLFNLNKYLKHLKINMVYLTGELDNEISNLINLEHLEIHNPKNSIKLNFQNLKSLIINHCNSYFQSNFSLNTPKLKKIKFNSIKNIINFEYNSESIKHLIGNRYNDQFNLFKNLEIMELNLFTNDLLEPNDDTKYYLDPKLLSIFKKLKQLKINLKPNYFNLFPSTLKDHLIQILNEKINLKRNFDIYLYGIKIIGINKLIEITDSKKNVLEYQIENYDLLDTYLPFVNKLNYTRLENCIDDLKTNLPSNFFDKYFNLYHIDVCDQLDNDFDLILRNLNYFNLDLSLNNLSANNLNWFLSNLKNLAILHLNGVSFDQHFYNNLPNTIRKLEIKNYDKNLNINFNFILNLPKLKIFILMGNNCHSDIFDLAIESFKNLDQLHDFYFRYGDLRKVKINKNNLFQNLFNRNRSNLNAIRFYENNNLFNLNIHRIGFSKNNNLFSLNLHCHDYAKVKITLNYKQLKQLKNKIISSCDFCINRKLKKPSKFTKFWNNFKNIF